MSTKPDPTSILKSKRDRLTEHRSGPREEIFSQGLFLKVLQLEQLRAERSGRRFVLMLIESENLWRPGAGRECVDHLIHSLRNTIRATDITGWYKDGVTIGTIFTEIGAGDGKAVTRALLTKVMSVLADSLSIEHLNQVQISFHVFPEDWDGGETRGPFPSALHRHAALSAGPKRASLIVKRAMDVAGSLAALLLLSPVLAGISIAIKLTSAGPILFKQQRVGLYGRKFTFLKFRSMKCNNDPGIHQAFTQQLIAGKSNPEGARGPVPTVFKIQNDPRVTWIGRFLRKTSLDELPQFINVLRGEMSLVGPRPPIPYEVKCYDSWHKRRLVAVKPGITGLWQVSGRSRVGFDDMVRLDLRYARSWSLWLDILILLQTPRAVVSGSGAY